MYSGRSPLERTKFWKKELVGSGEERSEGEKKLAGSGTTVEAVSGKGNWEVDGGGWSGTAAANAEKKRKKKREIGHGLGSAMAIVYRDEKLLQNNFIKRSQWIFFLRNGLFFNVMICFSKGRV